MIDEPAAVSIYPNVIQVEIATSDKPEKFVYFIRSLFNTFIFFICHGRPPEDTIDIKKHIYGSLMKYYLSVCVVLS